MPLAISAAGHLSFSALGRHQAQVGTESRTISPVVAVAAPAPGLAPASVRCSAPTPSRTTGVASKRLALVRAPAPAPTSAPSSPAASRAAAGAAALAGYHGGDVVGTGAPEG